MIGRTIISQIKNYFIISNTNNKTCSIHSKRNSIFNNIINYTHCQFYILSPMSKLYPYRPYNKTFNWAILSILVVWPNSYWKPNISPVFHSARPNTLNLDLSCCPDVDTCLISNLDSNKPNPNFQEVKWAPIWAHHFPAINAPRLSPITLVISNGQISLSGSFPSCFLQFYSSATIICCTHFC